MIKTMIMILIVHIQIVMKNYDINDYVHKQ